MTEGGGNLRWPVEGLVSCRRVGELPTVSQCEQVAEFLRKAQVASEQTGDAVLAHVLAVAHHICLACSQCRAEIEWHRRAYEGADQREHELRQKLHAILDLISGHDPPETPEKREGPPSAPTIEMSLPERDISESAERLNLWQRIQSPLVRRLPPPPPEPEAPEVSAGTLAPPPARKKKEPSTPSLAVYCLGPFRVYQDDKLITNWPSGKGKCIFKYMVANLGRPIPKDILMDLFWRDADPEAARNNLNVAIYGLRQAFRAVRPDFAHILFQDDCYLLNQAMTVWVDVEEFGQRYKAGQSFERRGMLAEAMGEYEVAEGLYQGDLLEEDLYQDWLIPRREGLKDSYLVILDRLSRYYLEEKRYATCIHLCRKILAKDDCREDAHRRLIRCYRAQGQRNLALRQYHLCAEALERVLDVPPMHETVALYHQIRRGEAV
jgi:DNA-binding SARP family transcriptional activator